MLFLNIVKKHKNSRIHITFDHMFSHDNYVTLMFTMRVGKQGITIWFKSFKQEYIDKEVSLEKGSTIAFNETLIIEGIKHVSALFGGKFDLIFLADRWFNSENILNTIASLGHTYCIRLKKNIKIFSYDKKEGHKIWKWLYTYHYTNIMLLFIKMLSFMIANIKLILLLVNI